MLYDPKTKTVYTPNTNQTTKLGEGGTVIGEERYNHNHAADGKFTSGTGSSSVKNGIDKSGESGIIETEKQKLLGQKLKNGEISLNINQTIQDRHIRGTEVYNSYLAQGIEKSYFNVPPEKLQIILKDNFKKGKIFISNGGIISERYDTHIENLAFDTKLKRNTSYVKASYSLNRTHLCPFSPKNKNKNKKG